MIGLLVLVKDTSVSPKDTPVRKAINYIARAIICRANNLRLISRKTYALLLS